MGGKGHECFMGHSSELPVKPIIMVVGDVFFKGVAWDDKIRLKQEPNRIVNGDAMGQQL